MHATSTGSSQGITGVGFKGDFVNALNGESTQDFNTITSAWCTGIGFANSGLNQRVFSSTSIDNQATMNNESVWVTAALLRRSDLSTQATSALSSFDSDGLTIAGFTAGVTMSFLVIKGGRWGVGDFTADNTTNNQNVSVGVGEAPAGLMMFSMNATTASNNANADYSVTISSADSNLNQGYTMVLDNDNVADSVTARISQSDKLLRVAATANATAASTATSGEAVINAMAGDGFFTIDWTDAINFIFIFFTVSPTTRSGTWLYFHDDASAVYWNIASR